MFKQKFALSLVVFRSHAAISLWFCTVFFYFFGLVFFLNRFSNPFIVILGLVFFLFEPNYYFSVVVLFVHMRHFDIGFLFFFDLFVL